MTDEFRRGLEAAASIADLYADEYLTMSGDVILLDRFLDGARSETARAAYIEDVMIRGCMHSASFHTARNIAAAIREFGN